MVKINIAGLILVLTTTTSASVITEGQGSSQKYIESLKSQTAKLRKISLGDYLRMAEHGSAWAQYNLGLIFSLGKGVEKDYNAAFRWFRRSANKKNRRAQFYLAMMYAGGRGVEKNKALASKWYRAAALNGFAPAQYNMGLIYIYGYGDVAVDKIRAYAWFNISAAKGHNGAREFLDSLERTMLIEDIKSAQNLDITKP